MAVYSEPIKWAIIIFPFLAFFISGALLIYEYRNIVPLFGHEQ